jgi:hypothetical protein
MDGGQRAGRPLPRCRCVQARVLGEDRPASFRSVSTRPARSALLRPALLALLELPLVRLFRWLQPPRETLRERAESQLSPTGEAPTDGRLEVAELEARFSARETPVGPLAVFRARRRMEPARVAEVRSLQRDLDTTPGVHSRPTARIRLRPRPGRGTPHAQRVAHRGAQRDAQPDAAPGAPVDQSEAYREKSVPVRLAQAAARASTRCRSRQRCVLSPAAQSRNPLHGACSPLSHWSAWSLHSTPQTAGIPGSSVTLR